MGLILMVLLALGGAVGVWFGFAEDIKLALLGGFIALVVATLQAFGWFGKVPELPEDSK